jgi:mono/diheme cytochrome c family protein
VDFPIFHLDFLNNRFLIGIIAVLHVLINHPLAVGGIPLVALLEWKGTKVPDGQSKPWDDLAFRILFVFFIVTTTVGAMTGVGIWLSASLVNPTAIGSLIRVFFWAWFVEWIVFVTEVALILYYFLSWRKRSQDKRKHVRLGIILAFASWVTMAIITAILAFMMDPGNWQTDRSLLQGFLNPMYLPQLFFRTPLAMVMGGAAGLFLLPFFTKGQEQLRQQAGRVIGKWMLAWLPILIAASVWYYVSVPDAMKANLSVANTTQEFTNWYEGLVYLMMTAIAVVAAVAAAASLGRLKSNSFLSMVPFLILLMLLSHFERVREFIRKPYAIGQYLYSNGLRAADYPLFKQDGLLKHAAYSSIKETTPDNRLQAGREIFVLACSRCHTLNGINNVRDNLLKMYGEPPYSVENLRKFMGVMHTARGYMPPFPGNETDADALARYLVHVSENEDVIPGSQTTGLRLTR